MKKGDPLFQIDPTPFQAKVDKIKADLDLAQRRLGEVTRLFEKGAGRKYDVELRTDNLAALKAELVEAEAEVMFTSIPGRVFKARVVKLWDEIAEGQLFPKGTRW